MKTPTSSSPGEARLKTLVVTDLVDSTRLVERLGDARAAEILAQHDRLARGLIERFDGREIDKSDGFLLLFERPVRGVAFALAYHGALSRMAAELAVPLAARAAVHVGEVFLRENRPEEVQQGAKLVEVEGLAKSIAARLMGLAGPHQTLLTRVAFDLARRGAAGEVELEGSLRWLAHGQYLFKGIEEPLEVFEVGRESQAPLAPPSSSEKARRLGEQEQVLGWRPAPGQAIPLRPHWVFVRKLGEGGMGEVWLARQQKTKELRVFKFCFDFARARALQREVTVCRLLREALGNRKDIVRLLDWNFEELPYFLELEYSEAGDLLAWSASRGGIDRVPLERRLELVAEAAEAVAAAHSVGVLHKDLKPANLLVQVDEQGEPHIRVTDFGIGAILDPSRLAELGITRLGLTELPAASESRPSGTRIYMAPEVLEGRPATIQADVFSLGVLTYQMVVGDFRRTLAPGWERDVADELLAEDIASFVDGRPERRVSSAAEISRRLRSLDARRKERAAQLALARQIEEDRQALEVARRRRRIWAVAAALGLLVASVVGVLAYRLAREVERANREARTAERVADFLAELFKGSDPNQARSDGPAAHELTARQLLDRGSQRILDDLGSEPLLQARLLDLVGSVYANLGLAEIGMRHVERALELRRSHLGTDHPETLDSLWQKGRLLDLQGDFDGAEKLFREALGAIQNIDREESALGMRLHRSLANTLVDLARFDEALTHARRARELARKIFGPTSVELNSTLQPIAYAYFKTGRYREASEVLREELRIREQLEGKDSRFVADTLNNLAVQLRELGELDEARALYERSLGILERLLPENHPNLASLYNNLAHVWQDQGHPDQALPYFERALTIRRSGLGGEHPLTALSENNLGYCLWLLDRRGEAAEHIAASLAIRERAFGADHPEVAVSLTNRALLEIAGGRLDDAARTIGRALEIQTKAFGSESLPKRYALAVAREVERLRGNDAAAEALAKELERIEQAAREKGARLPPLPLVRVPAP